MNAKIPSIIAVVALLATAPLSTLACDSSAKAPLIVASVAPVYPVSASGERIQGVVIVEGLVLSNGALVGATAIDAPCPELAKAAVEAVKQWQFQPATEHGQPKEAVVRIPVHFHINETSSAAPLLAFR